MQSSESEKKARKLSDQGNDLSDRAGAASGPEADRLFEQAVPRSPKAALELDPDETNVLFNWGIALADQALTASGDQADRLSSRHTRIRSRHQD